MLLTLLRHVHLRRNLSGIGQSLINHPTCHSFSTSSFRFARAPKDLVDLFSMSNESHHALARTWLDSFTIEDIPKDAYEVSYSRSSGPGGQVSRLPPSQHFSSKV